MTLKYESEILYGLMKRDGDDSPSDVLPYESELKEKYLNQVLGAYPKLQDYRAEWLNYNLNEDLPAEFPYETVYNVTKATVNNVVPYEYKSATLKGNTLVNLQQKGTTWAINGSGSEQNASYSSPLPTSLLKTSTKYFVKFNKDISTICKQFYFVQSTGIMFPLTTHSNGAYGIITTPSKLDDNTTPIHIYPKDGTTLTSEQVTDLQVMIIEYVEGMENWNIPYFESMQSVQMPVLTTLNNKWTNIPLSLIENCIGINGWTGFRCSYPSVKVTAKLNKFLLKSETQFRIAMNNQPILDLSDFKEKTMTMSNVEWIGFHTTGGTIGQGKMGNLLEYLTTGTLQLKFEIENEKFYPPYDNSGSIKSNILTVNEEVELRGIGEVQDELDLLSGELTQRIGVMVLDGIDMSMSKDSSNGDYVRFNLKKYKGTNFTAHDMKVKANLKCDKLPVLGDGTHSRECIHSGGASDYKLMIWLHQSKLSSLDNTGICQYLQQNPITVQYELRTESIKTVELTCTNEQGQIVQFKPIEGTMHVKTSSDTIQPLLDMEVPVEAITQNLNSFASMEE